MIIKMNHTMKLLFLLLNLFLCYLDILYLLILKLLDIMVFIKKHVMHDKMVMLVDICKRTFRKQLLKHELCILKFFNRNPYYCSKCNFNKCVPIYYHSKRGYHHIYKNN